MQPHAPPRRKSSAGVIFAVLLVVGFFFFCGLLIVGVAAFAFARADTSRAMAQRAMAIEQAQRARAEAETERSFSHAQEQLERAIVPPRKIVPPRSAVDAPAAAPTMQPIQVAHREITIQLNEEGQVSLDGKPVDGKQLEAQLRNAGRGREAAIAVTIKADKKCMFEHVASVLSICQKLDMPNVRIATAD